ncbi:MAG: hypothetical protein ACRDH2_12795, partial [Anaerolineales bacterium]
LLVSAEHAAPVAALLRILVPIYALYSLNAPGYYAAMGLRRPELNAAGALLGGVVTLLLMVGLIPAWGLMGAAWGNSGYILVGTINLGAARLTGLGVRKWLAEALPFAIGLLLLGGLVWVSGLLGAGSYPLVLFASLLALVPAWWIDRQSLVDLAHLSRRWIQRWRLVG